MTNQISFLGRRQVSLDCDPKTGVCNRCRYVVGEVHPVTGKVYDMDHMHHEAYDPNNVLKDTIELCPPCHNKAHWGGYVKKRSKLAPVIVTPEVHRALDEVGLRGESFSDIIMRLIKEHRDKASKK